jgi:pimeloyl-ACP methyl ester carboxylesterase
VPLDYSDLSSGTTAIAYIRKAATSKPVKEAESILLNPGGPGGSGVDSILAISDLLASYVGSEFNVIGFDPRGVNNSGPSLDCFPGNPEASREFASRFRRPIDSKNQDSITDLFQLAGGFGDWCSRVHSNSTARFANTPAVARDMLNFAEKNAEANGKVANEAKVWFWGWSYGTVLGTTFSALFPTRVGRVVLDGVVDAEDYYEGRWATGIVGTDKTVESFGKFCHDAGPGHCPFYFDSPEMILREMSNVLEDLQKAPITVVDPTVTESPHLVTYEDLAFLLFDNLYRPLSYPSIAQIFHDLQSRNGSALLQAIQLLDPTALNVGSLILCMDAAGRYNLSTVEKWQQHIDLMQGRSAWGADAFSSVALVCRQMNIVPPVSQQFRGYPQANHTSFPLLFIGNTADPITPIQG